MDDENSDNGDREPGAFYLLRPDLHVVGRWRVADADEIVRALRIGLGDTVS